MSNEHICSPGVHIFFYRSVNQVLTVMIILSSMAFELAEMVVRSHRGGNSNYLKGCKRGSPLH